MAALASLAVVVARRLAYPYDLEWMEGAMLNHALRLQRGEPLYAPPSLEFASFAYMPLYPAVVALLASVTGLGYAVARAVSVAGFALALVCGYAWMKEAGVARPYALGGLAVCAAAFAPTGAWYDLARVDSLFLGLVAATFVAAARAPASPRAAIAAGVLASAAFFTKQTAVPLVAAMVVGVALSNVRRAAVVVATGVAVTLPVLVVLHVMTGGWFWTYAFGLHQGHGFDVRTAFVTTPVRLALLLGPALVCLPAVLRREDTPGRFLAVTVVGALVASALGAGTEWAYANALIPGVFFGGLGVALAAARRAERDPRAAPALLALSILLAPGGLVWALDRAWPGGGLGLRTGYDLARLVPTREDRRAGDVLVARLKTAGGPVFVPFHTFYPVLAGQTPTLHAMNLADLNRAGLGTPRDLVDAIRSRTFAVIVLDVEEGGRSEADAEREAIGQFPRLAAHYAVVERIDGPRVISGAPVRLRLVMAPKPAAP